MKSQGVQVFTSFLLLTGASGGRYLGCFKEPSTDDRLLAGKKTDFKDTLTNAQCQEHCVANEMRYAGTENAFECFCDDARPGLSSRADESECDLKCEGNEAESCGGTLRISVFDTREGEPYDDVLTIEGCFDSSDEAPLLSGPSLESEHNSPEYCTGYCYLKGSLYAGLLNGTLCSCGDSLDAAMKVDEAECDESLSCRRLRVYNTGLPDITGSKYLGCFKDPSQTARLLSDAQEDLPGSLTNEVCVRRCKAQGHPFAGTELRTQCFCGDVRPTYKSLADEKDCNTPCDGNTEQMCGGERRISIHDVLGIEENPVKSHYLGCFRDPVGPNRLLPKGRTEIGTLTQEICVAHCYRKGYRLAGVQAGNECSCGGTLKPEKAARSEQCNVNCAGDDTLKCGGRGFTAVFHTGIADRTPEDAMYLGCFSDDPTKPVRLLSGAQHVFSETNTQKLCYNVCHGSQFKYSGTHIGKGCSCGNRKPPEKLEVDENQCEMTCPGDRNQLCGGSSRVLVYATGSNGTIVLPEFKPVKVGTAAAAQIETTQKATTQKARPQQQTPQQQTPQQQTWVRPAKVPFQGIQTLSAVPGSGAKPKPTAPPQHDPPDCEPSATLVKGKPVCKGTVIFKDAFSGDAIDSELWSHQVNMPQDPDYPFSFYDNERTNSFVKGGKLYIKPTLLPDEIVRKGNKELTDCTGQQFTDECSKKAASYNIIPPVQSARLHTKDTMNFQYGIITVRAAHAAGDWLLSSISLVPTRYFYGPRYTSGRVEVSLTRGNRQLKAGDEDLGSKQVQAGVQMGVRDNIKTKFIRTTLKNPHVYHNYSLKWTPDDLSFSIDGGPYESLIPEDGGTMSSVVGFEEPENEAWAQGSRIAPFDKDFYLALGLSCGGMRHFPDGSLSGSYVKPWKNNAVKAASNFWQEMHRWHETWKGDEAALKVDFVIITALD